MTTRPATLPFCAYPTAVDVSCHGVQPLPDTLPVADLTDADRYRSPRHRTTPAAELADAQLVEVARDAARTRPRHRDAHRRPVPRRCPDLRRPDLHIRRSPGRQRGVGNH